MSKLILPERATQSSISFIGALSNVAQANHNFIQDEALPDIVRNIQVRISIMNPTIFQSDRFLYALLQIHDNSPEQGTVEEIAGQAAEFRKAGMTEPAELIEDFIEYANSKPLTDQECTDLLKTMVPADALQRQLDEFGYRYEQIRKNTKWQDLLKKITTDFPVEFKSQEDFDQYWLNEITSSQGYQEMVEAKQPLRRAQSHNFAPWQTRALDQAGLNWYFSFWSAPMGNLNEHYYFFGFTNKGIVRLSSGRGMQNKLLIHSWPDEDVLIDTRREDNLTDEEKQKKNREETALKQFIDSSRNIDVSKRLFGTNKHIRDVYLAFMPVSMWRFGLGLGSLGISNAALLIPLFLGLCSLAIVAFIWVGLSFPENVMGMISGKTNIIEIILVIFSAILIFLTACTAITKLLFSAGAFMGTFQRAFNRHPMDSSNLPNTGKSNIILWVFSHNKKEKE